MNCVDLDGWSSRDWFIWCHLPFTTLPVFTEPGSRGRQSHCSDGRINASKKKSFRELKGQIHWPWHLCDTTNQLLLATFKISNVSNVLSHKATKAQKDFHPMSALECCFVWTLPMPCCQSLAHDAISNLSKRKLCALKCFAFLEGQCNAQTFVQPLSLRCMTCQRC